MSILVVEPKWIEATLNGACERFCHLTGEGTGSHSHVATGAARGAMPRLCETCNCRQRSHLGRSAL
jgi:hypothetical protein